MASSRRCCQNPCRKHGKEKTLLEHCCTSSRNKSLRCYRVRRNTEPAWKRSRRLGGAAAESAKRSHLKRRCCFRLAPNPAWGEPGGETAAVRENLLHRIAALTQHQRITPGMKKRLAQAAQLAEQALSAARLREIDSLVVKEIAADLGEIEKKHGEYRRVRSENLALRAALGEKLDAGEERFEKPADMQRRINALRSDNQALTQRVLKAAERAEIAHAVDATMAAMGYSLIGSKDASAEGTVKLYSFSNGTGIQVIHRADGIIRMKVVGLATPGHALDAADQAYLLTQQQDFCNAYESIVDALDKQGIRQVKGTVRALPPSAQFSQCVDVLEYAPHFWEAPQSGKRRAVNRPIQLTEGNG